MRIALSYIAAYLGHHAYLWDFGGAYQWLMAKSTQLQGDSERGPWKVIDPKCPAEFVHAISPGTKAVPFQPISGHPELDRLLALSKLHWASLSEEEREQHLRAQRESWARQGMD
jgi:hypothetical protein